MSRVEPERNKYVGHRYVPKLFGEWDQQNEYEGLSIVTYQGTSYTSKKRVPVGIDILNDDFWVVTGNYDAQIEYYRQDVRNLDNRITGEMSDLDDKLTGEMTGLDSKLTGEMSDLDGKLTGEMSDLDDQIKRTDIQIEYFGAVGDGVTDDSTFIKSGLDFGVENNISVNANKQYNVTENIDGLLGNGRDIKQILTGNGSITRDNDTFYFEPKGQETNVIYVGGSNHYLNDGITRNKPVAMSTAINYLQSLKENALDGHWIIRIVGYYNDRGVQRVKLPFFKNPIVIEGERDTYGDITTTVDGEGVSDNYFIRFDTGGAGQKFLIVRDIIFRNWKNHVSSAGAMSVWDNIDIVVEDCEAYDCSQFLWARNGRLRAYRNKIRGGHTGISAQYHTSFNMDNNDIKGFSRAGIHIGRNSAGRVSGNTFEDNYINIDCAQSSRLSTLSNIHKNWLFRGVNLYNNATWENGLEEIIEYDNPPDIPFYETFYGSGYNVIRSGLGLVKHYTQIPDSMYAVDTRGLHYMNDYFGSFLRTQDFSLRRGNMHLQVKLLVHSSLRADNEKEFVIKLSTSQNEENAYLEIPIKTTNEIVGEIEINMYFREKSTTAYALTKIPEVDGVRTQYNTFAHGGQFRGGNTLRAQSMYIDSIKGDFNVFGVLTYISQ